MTQRLHQAASVEGQGVGEQPVKHDAERPDVRSRIGQLWRGDLLRRHVARRAEAILWPRNAERLGRAQLFGEAEVEHLHAVAGRTPGPQKQVLWLDIPVNDAQGVRFSERLANLEHV